ncbi:MAG: hypothetical protein V4850_14260 [Myxococcota bacterium]
MLALSLLFAPHAAAQFPVDTHYGLYTTVDRAIFETGAIFVPPGQGTCTYTETWYLYEGYVYPSRESGVALTVAPVTARFETVDQFVREMRAAHPGGTIVTVENAEHRAGCR